MKIKLSTGYYSKFTKKERLLIEREKDRLERFFGGITTLKDKPDLLIVVDIRKEATAIREAKRKGVEIIGLVDTNSDPNEVTYPIPMNDDATKALNLVLEYIKQAILEGKGIKLTPVKKEVVEKVTKVNETETKKAIVKKVKTSKKDK